MSSLAAQLAQNVSLNAALLVDRSRKKWAESYLFTGREADQHDLESIYAIGVNGLLQLASLKPELRKYTETLFSDNAKMTDRTLLSSDSSAELDASIHNFLTLLGPYLMETPTGKVLEWLVKRFRINEFNVQAVLALFLPYHESPHFTKMLSILHIKPNSTWSFLLPFKSAAQHLPRVSLVTEMLKNTDVARFVTSLLPDAIKAGYCHRVLLAFNAACLHDFMLRISQLDEGTVAYLLPALLEPLRQTSVMKDAVLGSYVLLAAFSQKCRITPAALDSVIHAIASRANQVSAEHFTNTALSVLEPQAELESVSDKTLKIILQAANIEKEVRTVSTWVGSEKFLAPLLPGLVRSLDDEQAVAVFEAILTAPKASLVLMQRSAVLLIDSLMSTEMNAPSCRRLLGVIHQRHPSAFHSAVDEIGQREEIDLGALERLRIAVTQGFREMAHTGENDTLDMVVASADPDSAVRTTAVNYLVNHLACGIELNADDEEAVHSALRARVQDTSLSVLDALYGKPDTILPVLTEDAYLDSLRSALSLPGSKPKRTLLRSHLAFLLSHFILSSPMRSDDAFQRIVFPFLLFSKPRQLTADTAWDTISQSGAIVHEWIAGCPEILKEKSMPDANAIEAMSNLNIALASKIARNILRSDNYAVHFETLLLKLQDPDPHVKVLGYLIMRALLGNLSDEHQVDAAQRVLAIPAFEELSNIEGLLSGDEVLSESLTDMALAKKVVVKPNSKATIAWLQIAILSFIPHIQPPSGMTLNWFVNSSDDFEKHEQRSVRYVELLRTVYNLANISTSSPLFTAGILQTLFSTLKTDTLAFLAGIRTGSSSASSELRTVALYHGAAFLQAHIAECSTIDFQTILPSLLVALQSDDANERQIALTCISCIRQLSDRKFSSVYAFDTIYGKNTMQVLYLDQDDFKRYLSGLLEHQDHFLHDPRYVEEFHSQHLGGSKADKKRDHEYKRRVLCFLTSHINPLGLPTAQVALLRSLGGVSNSAKADNLLSIIKTVFASQKSMTASEELATLLIACFDSSTAEDMNETDNAMWDIYVSVLNCAFASGTAPIFKQTVSRVLGRGLASSLNQDRKVALFELLLGFGTQDTNNYTLCKGLLSDLLEDVPLILHVLDILQPPAGKSRPAKRIKTAESPEDVLRRLSLFAEALSSKKLPGSLELVSGLLEALNRLLPSISSAKADVNYIGQLLMFGIETAAKNIKEMPNLSPNAIRLEVLVELLRTSDNPQTFQQALLLVADLAHLAPESVLHNVMPIFTFMGANVFHRDDAYSFKVVQQTVDRIVPVMVSSLKHAHVQPLDLRTGSKEFLKVFTDAASHIPRHRRSQFFIHLVEVLGPEDFISPISMLLVDKARIVKQIPDDMQTYLTLPSAILHHYPSHQFRVLRDILQEAQNLMHRSIHPERNQPVFLVTTEETTTGNTALLRRRALALVIFVGHAFKPSAAETVQSESPDGDLGHLVSALISLAHFQSNTSLDGKANDMATVSRSSLDRMLRVMSASEFIKAVLLLVQDADPLIQREALELLAQRLSGVSQVTRQAATPTIVKIMAISRSLLNLKANEASALSALFALKAIITTLCPGEESSAVEMIPTLLTAVKVRALASSAMSTLSNLPSKIGPRIIPHFRGIVSQTVAIIREGSSDVQQDALSVLQNLLSSIPTFWGPGEIKQIIALHADSSASSLTVAKAPMTRLIKSVAKKVPPKVLVPAMIDLWPSLQNDSQPSRVVPYFDMLSKALRSADRPTVLEQLRSLFKVFLEAFGFIATLNNPAMIEGPIIGAFKELVVKLNDAAFRPLFRRLFDWAFTSESEENTRKTMFCKLYIGLLDFFKGLITPYMSFLLDPFIETLRAYSSSSSDDVLLWTGVIETITKTLAYDEGSFWRDDKLRHLASPLVQQASVSIQLGSPDGRAAFQRCLEAYVGVATDVTVLKTVNLDLLMFTRSEDVTLRIFVLDCAEKLWRAHGNKLLGFASETTTFIAECSEDENDMVVRESFKLKDVVESVAGSLNGL